jgi:transcription elongation factor/antiterminator RfaH
MPSGTLGASSKPIELNDKERWYLVHSLPRSEFRAHFHLESQGFRPYVPQILKTTRHARQVKTVRAPFFPRYLFVALDLERERWLSIRSTFGVSSLVTCDDRPIPVPTGIVEALLAQTDAANLARLDDGLRAGQQITVQSGPFANVIGTLERLDDNGRVRVLLQVMGGVVPVSIDRSRVLRIS